LAALKKSVLLALVLFWCVASYRAVLAELSAVQSAPDILGMSYDEKRLMADGPIYKLWTEAPAPVADAKILFISQFAGDRHSYYSSKLKYYLAPRGVSVVSNIEALSRLDAKEFDRVYYYVPSESDLSWIGSFLGEANEFAPIFSSVERDGYLGVYGIGASQASAGQMAGAVTQSALLSFFAVAVFVVAGLSIVKLMERIAGGKSLFSESIAPGCAAGFLVGLGAVSLSMLFYSMAGIPITRLSIALPWAVFAVFMHCYPARQEGVLESVGHGRPKDALTVLDYLFLAIILLQACYALFASMPMPVTGWDAWAIWFLKAKAFYLGGGVTGDFLKSSSYSHAHPDYPLLVPLSIAWLFECMGTANDILGKLIYPLKFIALLVVFYYVLRRLVERKTALAFTLLLALTPIMIAHSAGLPEPVGRLYTGDYVGYADLSLSIFFMASAILVRSYLSSGKSPDLLLAAIFFGLGAWTKNEGLLFALVGFILVAGTVVYKKRDFKPFFGFALIVAVFIVPWFLYREALSLRSDFAGSYNLTVFFDNIERFPVVFAAFMRAAFLDTALYGLTWHLYVVVMLLTLRRGFSSPDGVLNILVVCQAGAYAFVYIITPSDLSWHIGTSLDRVIMHLVPLALFSSALGLDTLFGKKADGELKT
jgi:hypothetical protein